MCLDPRPDRPFRLTRSARSLSANRSRVAISPSSEAIVVRQAALRAIEHLAADDDLVARGWVVLSREA